MASPAVSNRCAATTGLPCTPISHAILFFDCWLLRFAWQHVSSRVSSNDEEAGLHASIPFRHQASLPPVTMHVHRPAAEDKQVSFHKAFLVGPADSTAAAATTTTQLPAKRRAAARKTWVQPSRLLPSRASSKLVRFGHMHICFGSARNVQQKQQHASWNSALSPAQQPALFAVERA